MRVSRIRFDDSEPTESIVSRIACAFDPGNILKVRDIFFKMSPQRVMNQTVAGNVVGDNYTLILNPGDPVPESLLKPEPPAPPVVTTEPEPEEPDWDAEASAVEPDPIPEVVAQEPVEVPVEPEPVVEPVTASLEAVPDPIGIDFCRLAAVPTELPRQNVAEVDSAVPPSNPDSVPPPPASEVFMSRPPPSIDGKPLTVDGESTPTSESGEYRLELPKSRTRVEPGQVWQSKDTRRNSPPFVVKNVDSEFVYPDNGKRIALNRMIRYKRVS